MRALFPAAIDVQRDRFFRALRGVARSARRPRRAAPAARTSSAATTAGTACAPSTTTSSAGRWSPPCATTRGTSGCPSSRTPGTRPTRVVADAMQTGAREAAAPGAGVVEGRDRRARAPRRRHRGDRRAPRPALRLRARPVRQHRDALPAAVLADLLDGDRARRPDGLLEFHVRAVGAGWVSGPLVWRAQVGDVLRHRCTGRRDAHRPPVPPRRAVRGRRHRAGADQGDGRRHVQVEHRTPGHACSSASAGPATSTTSTRCSSSPGVNRWLTVVPVVSDEPSYRR